MDRLPVHIGKVNEGQDIFLRYEDHSRAVLPADMESTERGVRSSLFYLAARLSSSDLGDVSLLPLTEEGARPLEVGEVLMFNLFYHRARKERAESFARLQAV